VLISDHFFVGRAGGNTSQECCAPVHLSREEKGGKKKKKVPDRQYNVILEHRQRRGRGKSHGKKEEKIHFTDTGGKREKRREGFDASFLLTERREGEGGVN